MLPERFTAQAARTPCRPAVVAPDGALTFAELSARAADYAAGLAARGVRRGDVVGVGLRRGADLPAVLLAVWLAGAAYLPLDPAYPARRRAAMLADAGARLMVDAPGELAGSTAAPGPGIGPHDPAYVIFTSGSTGRPKGVQVGHGNVAHLLDAMERGGYYSGEARRVAWNASMSFDASVQQWIRLCRGDTLVLLDDDLRTEPDRFAAYLRAHGVTDLDVTPSHWDVLGAPLRDLPLRLFIGGEPVPPSMWTDLADAPHTEALNVYGPTECTVDATAAWVRGDAPHLGEPLPGVRAHVLDDLLLPVDEGELYLTGAGVSHGYINRPGPTAQAFVADPFATDGSRMYRTGDRVRRRADGTLAYLGRVDLQVKVRGHRVELGEIEAVLTEVARGVVTFQAPNLVAYHVGADTTAEALRGYLAERLPDYMVPSVFVALDALPRSVAGKVDRSALPAPPGESGAAEALRGPVERLIARTWADVLDKETVRADDDFFALGGHSLVALRVVARLKRELGLSVRTRTVYAYPKLRDLATHVEGLLAQRR